MIWIDYLPLAFSCAALLISIAAFASTQLGISNRARASAIRKVEQDVIGLEAENAKLHKLLNRALMERIGLKEQVMMLKKGMAVEQDKAN